VRRVIPSLKVNETIKEHFLLTSLQTKLGKNGTYFEMTLADASGEIKARKWDLTEKDYQLYDVIHKELPQVVLIKGITRQFQQTIDLKVFYIVYPDEETVISISEFLPAAPIDVEDAYRELEETITSIRNETLKKIVGEVFHLYKPFLAQYPASIHGHQGYGGLLWHILNTVRLSETVIGLYPKMLNRDLLISGAILHDLAKIKDYKLEKGIVTKVTDRSKFVGHIVTMAHDIRETARMLNIDVNSIEVELLEHMILSHHGKGEYGSPVQPSVPEAFALHLVDVLDTRLGVVQHLWEKTPQGEWSEWSKVLEKRIKKIRLEG
jgi:3'-5' exoribonuclease